MYVFPRNVTLLITAKQKVRYDLLHRCVIQQLGLLFRVNVVPFHSFSVKVLVQSSKAKNPKKKSLQRYRVIRIRDNYMENIMLKMLLSKNDRSKWPARPEFDRSSPQSGRTLSIDRPLFWALTVMLFFSYLHLNWPKITRSWEMVEKWTILTTKRSSSARMKIKTAADLLPASVRG